MDEFKASLSAFKPKQSVLEINLIKSMDQDRLNKFQSILSLQNEKYKEKLDRVAYASEVKKQIEAE